MQVNVSMDFDNLWSGSNPVASRRTHWICVRPSKVQSDSHPRRPHIVASIWYDQSETFRSAFALDPAKDTTRIRSIARARAVPQVKGGDLALQMAGSAPLELTTCSASPIFAGCGSFSRGSSAVVDYLDCTALTFCLGRGRASRTRCTWPFMRHSELRQQLATSEL